MNIYSLYTETDINIQDVIEATLSDKKMESGKIKFILLENIGEGYIDTEVSKKDMSEALNSICKKI